MRIIHCAPFNIFTKTGGSLYAIPVQLSSGLTQNNHFVHNFDYRDTARYLSFFRNKKSGTAKMNTFFKNLINEINPDLIIFGHAELVEIETFEFIKNKNIKTIFWYNDTPISNEFSRFSPFLDFAFATAGGEFVENMKKVVINSFFMPNTVDINSEKYRSFENETYKNDILVASRVDAERKELFAFLENKINPKISKFFLGQNRDNIIIGDDYFQTITNSKITINPNRANGQKYDWYTSDRLMHILGNGAFALTTPIINNEIFFEDKLKSYSSHEDLKEKIDYYLNNDKERRDLSKWLHKRTHELFNAKRVAKYILDILENKDLKEYEWAK
ncbi:MAG: glycosyltransferase [Campylobacteraceae bacterium]